MQQQHVAGKPLPSEVLLGTGQEPGPCPTEEVRGKGRICPGPMETWHGADSVLLVSPAGPRGDALQAVAPTQTAGRKGWRAPAAPSHCRCSNTRGRVCSVSSLPTTLRTPTQTGAPCVPQCEPGWPGSETSSLSFRGWDEALRQTELRVAAPATGGGAVTGDHTKTAHAGQLKPRSWRPKTKLSSCAECNY